MVLLIQASIANNAWTGPVAALSLAAIALGFLVIAVIAAVLARRAHLAGLELAKEIHALREEIGPAIRALNTLAVQGESLATKVGEELNAVLATSRRTRAGFERGLQRAAKRLENLDALAEVIQDELDDTALSAAATVRTFRSASGAIRLIGKVFARRRR